MRSTPAAPPADATGLTGAARTWAMRCRAAHRDDSGCMLGQCVAIAPSTDWHLRRELPGLEPMRSPRPHAAATRYHTNSKGY
eukprot:scaffold32237_cov96-Isochrysis_galbana.AAC.1